MNRLLRVFISSTMRDLANERDALCARLRKFNFEPVNAEGWSPSGVSSWATIAETLESCDIVILLLGERYGWIPDSGPMSEKGLSVTHLEFREAKRLNITVLPFFKNLSYDSDRTSDDAKRRDAFREEVARWADGTFVSHFDLARDLAQNAADAIVRLLTSDFLKSRVKSRAASTDNIIFRIRSRIDQKTSRDPISLPQELVNAVVRNQAILIAGAGMSLAAGLPSSMAACSLLSQVFFPAVEGASQLSFAQLAAAIEYQYSRDALLKELAKLLDPPQGASPTPAHMLSLELFNQIITTNWDSLFESAAAKLGDQRSVVQTNTELALPARVLVKLHGSLSTPSSVVFSEQEIYRFADSHDRLWSECKELISRHTPVFVGTSLHDPSVIRLLEESASPQNGFIVMPHIDQVSRYRLRAWNLEIIEATADDFLEALSHAVQNMNLG